MAKTKSEKLAGQVGQQVACEICHQELTFGPDWLMTSGKKIVCPKCQPKVSKEGGLLVNIC